MTRCRLNMGNGENRQGAGTVSNPPKSSRSITSDTTDRSTGCQLRSSILASCGRPFFSHGSSLTDAAKDGAGRARLKHWTHLTTSLRDSETTKENEHRDNRQVRGVVRVKEFASGWKRRLGGRQQGGAEHHRQRGKRPSVAVHYLKARDRRN